MKKTPLTLSICIIMMAQAAEANNQVKRSLGDSEDPVAVLNTITVTAAPIAPTSLAFDNAQKASDVVVSNEKLRHRSATLGNALSDELGVHSNPFGGGASAPVVRGQEGVRVKILQNGMDAIDMSTLSPDHAVGVDTLLADRVELIRGASTL